MYIERESSLLPGTLLEDELRVSTVVDYDRDADRLTFYSPDGGTRTVRGEDVTGISHRH